MRLGLGAGTLDLGADTLGLGARLSVTKKTKKQKKLYTNSNLKRKRTCDLGGALALGGALSALCGGGLSGELALESLTLSWHLQKQKSKKK